MSMQPDPLVRPTAAVTEAGGAYAPWGLASRALSRSDLETAGDFPLAFPDAASLQVAARDTAMLADYYVARLAREHAAAPQLPSDHGYWRDLLLPWVLLVCQSVWGSYVYWRRALDDGKVPDAGPPFPATPPGTPFASTLDFINRGLFDSRFAAWVDGMIVGRLAPGCARFASAGEAPAAVPAQDARAAAPGRSLARRTWDRMAPIKRFTNVAGVGGWAIAFHTLLSLLPRRRVVSPALGEPPGDEILGRFPADFLAVLEKTIAASCPESLDGGLAAAVAAKRDRPYRRGRLRVGTLDFYDDDARIERAEAGRAGERIVSVQHGGYYGYSLPFPDPAEIEYRREAFVTWGWTGQGDYRGHFVPAPSPRLSAVAGRHRRTSDTLIFVGTQIRLHPWRLFGAPQPAQWLDYLAAKCRFLSALPPSLRQAALYRAHPIDAQDIDDRAFIVRELPDVRLLEDRDFDRHLLGCRLLVLDHPGTTLCVAMAANTPTLCYWDSDAWPMSGQSEPYFSAMRRVGILHDAPEAAADHARRVWQDVEGWWTSAETQSVRRQFVTRYARADRFWPIRWWGMLWGLHFRSACQ